MFIATDAVPAHVGPLLDDLRPEDRDEWVATTARPTRLAVRAAVRVPGAVARTALGPGGEPLVMWGAVPTSGGYGEAWLIATRSAVPLGLAIMRDVVVDEQARLDAAFPVQRAWSDRRNLLHHRWLRWMGFRPVWEGPFGPYGLPFIGFERTTECAPPKQD